ncbi:hypothetical protein [Rhodoplanes serenus]|uniref:hypothetical protein n=1 Tax=Rhodoplanes serenus TaxID=200615 RepID=UPI0011B941C6|nr:hypothetical protein [Rhodoplanes serenus]
MLIDFPARRSSRTNPASHTAAEAAGPPCPHQRSATVAQSGRPYSLAALANPARLAAECRCTAVPNCAAAGLCPATPAMRRACEQAFGTWVRRGVAVAPPHARWFDDRS